MVQRSRDEERERAGPRFLWSGLLGARVGERERERSSRETRGDTGGPVWYDFEEIGSLVLFYDALREADDVPGVLRVGRRRPREKLPEQDAERVDLWKEP